MRRKLCYCIGSLLVASQAAAAILPPVPTVCWLCDDRCPCLPPAEADCGNCCDGGSCRDAALLAPLQCACQSEQAPPAAVAAKQLPAALAKVAAPVAAHFERPERLTRAAAWESWSARRAHVPDIPVRILFCTWLE
jgi:hypothetical protein